MKKNLYAYLLSLIVISFGSESFAENTAAIVPNTTNHPKILFFDESSISSNTLQDSTSKGNIDLDALADSLTKKVLGDNRVVDMLDPDKIYTLPLGIVKVIGGISYIIVLDELSFTPSGAVMKAYMSLTLPGSSKNIGFVAENVKVGIKGIEAAKLKMLRNRKQDLLGQELEIIADSTFVEWDCNGYKGLQLTANLFLDNSVFVKINANSGAEIIGANAKATISCYATDLNDILITAKLEPFQINKLRGYSFYSDEITLDLSDTRNAPGMVFPDGYTSAFFDGEEKSLWRGLYIKSLRMKFPSRFTKNGKTPEVLARDFLIDIEGITGNLSYKGELISFENGNLGGWKFSVNTISVSFMKNRVSAYGMAGGIILPITDPKKPLDYTAFMDANDNFLFQVKVPDNISAPVFGDGTTLTLNSNSTITVEYKNGEFYPKANLHGKMKVKVGSAGVELANIDFQGLVVQTVEPKINIQSFSMTSGAMAGFPVQINQIALEKNAKDSLLGLRFDATANLMNETLNGSTQFVVWAQNKNGNDWKYKSTELRAIKINAKTNVFELDGTLSNYKDDPTYGNGYYGSLYMGITPGIKVEASAQFGNINGMRYWFADAGVAIPAGVPVLPGFAIYGFGGGAYYHMSRTVPANIQMVESTRQDSTQNTQQSQNQNTNTSIKLGVTRSGITYTPSENIGLGVLAKVIIGTSPKPDAFNGSATFGIEFNSGGGVNKISFAGDGRFMTKMEDNSPPKVRATVNIEYVFKNKELFGNASAYINVANVVKGGGPNNLAGEVNFYFAQKEWYIYIGTPQKPINLEFMSSLKSTSYFMVGTRLPDFPELPNEVKDLAKSIDFSNLRNQELAKNAGGFAFGASIRANTGEQEFLIFYGKFDMGAGFDLMLSNYGSNARCEGRSGPLGINGWYAQGQAWAWVNALIGVKVRVLGDTKKFNILDAGFAAVLGAQLPNPTYLAGAARANFSVLGGLVKGTCHFEFHLGEQCKLVGASAVEGVTVIAEMTPREGDSQVDVFTTPQVVFNMPIDKEFDILDSDGKTKKFRVKLDYCRLEKGGTPITAAAEWSTQNDVLALRPTEVLPGETNLKFMVGVRFQVLENNVWKDYTVNGKVETETKALAFKTGPAPDYITENNVVYTYPARNMLNFYKNEYGKCYIQLSQGVDYLFNKPGNWRYEAHFKSGQNISLMPVTYVSQTKRVELEVPDNLVNEAIYSLKIVRVEDTGNQFVADKNVTRTDKAMSDELSMTKKQVEQTLTDESLTELYSLNFRTSKYNTFGEKLNNLSFRYSSFTVSDFIKQLHILYIPSAPSYELFDSYELGYIGIQAVLDETPWYTEKYKDLVYKRYPLAQGMEITWREINPVGVPPVNSASMVNYGQFPVLDEQAITQGKVNYSSGSNSRIEYNLCYYVTKDWGHLRDKTFYAPTNEDVENLKKSSYAGIYYNSTYPVRVNYFVPGVSQPTSSIQKIIRF